MLRWDDLERGAPGLAAVAHERLIAPGVMLVATVRRDGTARVSPVEPLVLDGDLWLSMMWKSRKAEDLLRDPRVLLHSIVTSRDGREGELKIRGAAIAVNDADRRARYRAAVAVLGWQPEEPWFHLFRIDLLDVSFVRYAPNGDQYTTRWPAHKEFVRRATSPTSVGPPEPTRELLGPPPRDGATESS